MAAGYTSPRMVTHGLSLELFGDDFADDSGTQKRVTHDQPAAAGAYSGEDVNPAESDLVRECLEGRKEACRTLFHRIHPAVMPICMRYTDDAEDAANMLKEGSFRLFQALSSYKGEVPFQDWAERIMIEVAIERFHALSEERKKASMEELDSGDAYALGFTPDEVFSRFSMNDLLKAVQRLSPLYRTIFNLHIIEGWKHEEIATALRISAGASRSGLNRARMRLMDQLIRQDPTLLAKRKGHGQ